MTSTDYNIIKLTDITGDSIHEFNKCRGSFIFLLNASA